MNSSDIPSRIVKPFGVNGLKNTIPVDSSTITDANGVATFDKGFPAITMQPLSAGGIPPSGKDMNGSLYAVSAQQQWFNAGGGYPFNAGFASSIGGYPAGAVVPSSDFAGFWQNTINGNSTNPENASGLNTGWVPHYFYGSSAVSIGSTNYILTALQAARDEIVLTGDLTSNVYLYFPPWVKSWRVVNNCTGNFNVILATISGSVYVSSYPATTMEVRSDGASIFKIQSTAISNNGYQDLNSGLSFQWMTGSITDATVNTVYTMNFPKPFQNACIQCVGSFSNGGDITQKAILNVINFTKSYVTFNFSVGGTQGARFLAIGY